MIFDELISGVTEVITDSIDTFKDATSDVREEVHDTKESMTLAIEDILKSLKED